ncbi:hypothetical protein ACH4E5_02260 [Streptomyces afghaniensis]|uniref:hypothetical protein n=1 Tax=Streptomyces afghaniensis TaxID=66865 RepID=UPI0037BA69A4
MLELAERRVLVWGSRRWPWPSTVEGAATGADAAACGWCRRLGLGNDRHRCHPVDWTSAKRERPQEWRMAGPERNTRCCCKSDW